MPNKRIKPKSWNEIVSDLINLESRYMIRRSKKTPFLSIKDKLKNKEFSLRPIRAYENMPEIQQIALVIEKIGDKEWPIEQPIESLIKLLNDEEVKNFETPYTWNSLRVLTLNHLTKSMKGSSQKNIKADLNNLHKLNYPFKWSLIKDWLYEKEITSRPFKNRLDSLEQIRLAITNEYGTEPHWLTKNNLTELRQIHNSASKKIQRYQTAFEMKIRGIPTRKEAEEYLNSLWPDYKLEQWCIAMLLNYGLRNHELHHIFFIDETIIDEGLKEGCVLVPGESRTKSKYEHFVWPLYPTWIIEYGLKNRFNECQRELRQKAKMVISSAKDKTKKWKEGDPTDLGVCENNDYLGNWITNRMKNNLPSWYASVPDARGISINGAVKQKITPYDLRHTWAIRMATDPRCVGITDELAAQAMGHDVSTHRKHYQKWLSQTEIRKTIISNIKFPSP